MKKIYKLLLTVSIVGVSSQAAGKIITHKIKSGETLYVVAHKHHSTIEEVRKLNGIQKGEILKVGRVVKVPTNTYFPEKNKTKRKLAEKTNKAEQRKKTTVTKRKNVKKVLKKNSDEKRTKLATYGVQKGDTLYTIAKKHKMTVAKLVKINQIDYKATLKLGQKLKVLKIATEKKKIKTAKIVKKKQKKIKIVKIVKKVKKKTSNRILRTALKKQAKPLASKRVKRRRVTADDIFFKSMSPKLTTFNKGIDARKAHKITSLAKQKLGRKYVWGATGQNAFDCSGLTTYVYKKNGIQLPRRAIAQSKVGKRISKNQLKPGDLVFFDTSKQRKGYVNHVGIYIGNGKFIHASSAKKKVVITNLNKPFYSQRFKVARRLASSS